MDEREKLLGEVLALRKENERWRRDIRNLICIAFANGAAYWEWKKNANKLPRQERDEAYVEADKHYELLLIRGGII